MSEWMELQNPIDSDEEREFHGDSSVVFHLLLLIVLPLQQLHLGAVEAIRELARPEQSYRQYRPRRVLIAKWTVPAYLSVKFSRIFTNFTK